MMAVILSARARRLAEETGPGVLLFAVMRHDETMTAASTRKERSGISSGKPIPSSAHIVIVPVMLQL
jgi:hypothetical protein